MRKVLSIVAFLALSLSMMAGIHTYTETSVLAKGTWKKIRISETGVCRMSFSEIESAGLNPQKLRVFGYGGAQKLQDFSNPNIDDLPQVPVYVGTDYVLFWVQGPISWTYDAKEGRFVHTRNTYSDYGYYFLTDTEGELLAPKTGEAVSGEPTDITTYAQYQVHDFDSLNLIDRNGVSGGGRTFYGEQFKAGQTRSFSISTPNAVTSEQSKVYVEVAANSSTASSFKATVNGSSNSVAIGTIPDFYTMAIKGTISLTPASTADAQVVELQYINSAAGSLGWLNYIEVTTPSGLTMNGSYLPVRTLTNLNSATPVRFCLANANANTQVWDVTNLADIKAMNTSLSNDTLYWVGSQADGVHEYVAVNTAGSQFVEATVLKGTVDNQNLHTLNNKDYIIICPQGYEAYAINLAEAHRIKQGITYEVVTDQQVYNEFSSGTPDATAYRWLMKMLYDRADGISIKKPRWLLLMGHGTFDNRKLLPNSGTSLLLTYQAKNSENEVNAYATDDYFGFLDDNEGESDTGGRMDIGVGRLPVESLDEARSTVEKLIKYIRNESSGKWKNQVVYLADDGENGTHTETAEKSAEMVRQQNPDFVVHKIFLDAYPQEVNASGESYPLAKNRLTNLLKSGVLFFDYSGHGGYNAITNESILNIKDIENMTNHNHAFWLFATCSFAHCDAGKRSSAEAAVLNSVGGAIGVLAATRTVYAGPNTELNRKVSYELFAHQNTFHYDATLGEAVAKGKNNLGSDANKMAYVLLGDPAIRLNYPTEYYVETTTKMDTLNALSIQEVDGQIVNEDSLVVTQFNGNVDITIYDKMQSIPTRDNDNVGGEPKVVAYNDYPNTIFTGSTEVKDGLFHYTFMVPKDIRYNFGNGRIVYYASAYDSLETKWTEAVGHFEKFIVGGTNPIALVDTIGPEVHIYLNNNPAFKDGDVTGATPLFMADLFDENGINTAGAGIGHDLMLVIDDSPVMIYSLNEYFTAQNNSYKAGQIAYSMTTLPEGSHSLTFRAWDMLNNSTTKSLNFYVNHNFKASISSVMSYPNPVQTQGILNLLVNYDQPDDIVAAELFLYDINGQLVYHRTQDTPDMRINLGELSMRPGVYVYSIRIQSSSNKYSRTSGKIIVTQ